MTCEYRDCEKLSAESGEWPLCRSHREELQGLIEAGDAKKVLGFWARGQSEERKDKMARQIGDGAGRFLKALRVEGVGNA